MPAFADDSGLAVDALDGEPGIHSARWAGPDKDFARAMEKVDAELRARRSAPRTRRAHFIAALCLAWPDGHVEEFEGRVDGTLVWPPRGSKGFGYDPMFLPDGYDRTFGEMSRRGETRAAAAAASGLSHRARAFLKLAEALPVTRAGLERPDAFGVYVHWPFCLSKCPYCDFNCHVRHAPIDEARFVARLRGRDRRHRRARARPHRLDHLLRRRHALADGSRPPSGRSSTPSRGTGPSPPTPR